MSRKDLLTAPYGNEAQFLVKRRALFKKLDFALGSLARQGMSFDDDKKLKRALGLSSKGMVNHWKTAGVGDIPGYATHCERVASVQLAVDMQAE